MRRRINFVHYLQMLEREKLKQSARIAEGFSDNACFSQGLVVGGDDLAGQFDSGNKGLVIPWGGNPNIKIVVGVE